MDGPRASALPGVGMRAGVQVYEPTGRVGVSTMRTTKTVFTTGEAARICKVSQQTIIRCFDSGQLKGFRVPGSRFRRIPRETLHRFMKENGIPTDALDNDKREVLLVDDDLDLVEVVKGALDKDGRFDVKVANNGFDAGMIVKEHRPELIVLDVMLPDINGREVCQRVRSDNQLEEVKILCISGMVEPDKIDELRAAGANDFLQKPFEVEQLIERMCTLLGMETGAPAGR
jgi:excisionase family DNA binding protein